MEIQEKTSRKDIFGRIAHEMKHAQQHYNILRTENLGKTYAEELIKTELQLRGKNFPKELEQLRTNVIKSMGELPENSTEGRRSIKYLNSFKAANGIKNKGSKNYYNSITELEAYLKQFASQAEYANINTSRQINIIDQTAKDFTKFILKRRELSS